eukprot:jgi/Astpho2/6592/Aster-04961
MADDQIEHTLFISREVSVFKIPSRVGAGGHKSAEWLVADKIFTGRLRAIAKGESCEIRMEDTNSGDVFAVCPVPLGQSSVAVEPVTDSSRYFVLRVVDPTTKRHAFLGMGFSERSEAFDFNVALQDHEKHVQRAKEVKQASTQAAAPQGSPAASAGRASSTEAAALYKKQDLSLKEGQTIKIAMKKPAGSEGGFLSGLSSSGGSGVGAKVAPLAPPPKAGQAPAFHGSKPLGGPQQQQQDPYDGDDLLGLGSSQQAQQAKPAAPAAASQEEWTAFS